MGLFRKLTGLFSSRPQHGRDFDPSSQMPDSPSGWELPPLSSGEAQAVLTQSEMAALEATPDDAERINPHPPGSRKHRLWEENFKAVQEGIRRGSR